MNNHALNSCYLGMCLTLGLLTWVYTSMNDTALPALDLLYNRRKNGEVCLRKLCPVWEIMIA
jgi:hypothetical protein